MCSWPRSSRRQYLVLTSTPWARPRRQLGWGQRPPVDAIRIEESNFYDYTTPAPPTSGDALAMAAKSLPPGTGLPIVRIGISAKRLMLCVLR